MAVDEIGDSSDGNGQDMRELHGRSSIKQGRYEGNCRVEQQCVGSIENCEERGAMLDCVVVSSSFELFCTYVHAFTTYDHTCDLSMAP